MYKGYAFVEHKAQLQVNLMKGINQVVLEMQVAETANFTVCIPIHCSVHGFLSWLLGYIVLILKSME